MSQNPLPDVANESKHQCNISGGQFFKTNQKPEENE